MAEQENEAKVELEQKIDSAGFEQLRVGVPVLTGECAIGQGRAKPCPYGGMT